MSLEIPIYEEGADGGNTYDYVDPALLTKLTYLSFINNDVKSSLDAKVESSVFATAVNDIVGIPVNQSLSTIQALGDSIGNNTNFSAVIFENVGNNLNSLAKIANAINNDDAFSTTINNALDEKASLSGCTFTGVVSGISKSMVGLSNVENIADLDKVVSTATQTALDLKADLSGCTFTGNVSGITKSMVGLSNVENIADLDKVVSTATQTALDLKANLVSPTFTGIPAVPTATQGSNSTQIASCAYIDTAIANLIGSAPNLLNSIQELSTALNNDPDAFNTLNTAISNKAGLGTANTFTEIQTFSNACVFSSTATFNTNLPTSTQTPSTSTQLITKGYADGAFATLSAVQSNANTFSAKQIFNGQMDVTYISEKIVATSAVSSAFSTADYSASAVCLYTPANATAVGLALTNVPTDSTYKTYTISCLIDSATYKVKFTSLKINGTDRTSLVVWEGANNVDLSTANVICQRFKIIHTTSASVPWKIISSVSTFT